MTDWNAPVELSAEEERILKLCKKQKLWGFLRQHRHVILDNEIRQELAQLYSDSGRGRPPECPERLALATLLQAAFDVADHEVPALTVVDRRWQMVLDCLEVGAPVFSQGSVFNFRERARASGLMTRLLEKTIQLARSTKGFSHKRLRAIFDSSPLLGAGRVEDSFNLLGRAMAKLVDVAAREAGVSPDAIAGQLGLSVVGASSVKAALDVDWREPTARSQALSSLITQFRSLQRWLESTFEGESLRKPPLREPLETVERIIAQDTEPDPTTPGEGANRRRIKNGADGDRVISLSDKDMRHGRKSKSKVFSGYKRHVAVDADIPGLICAVDIQPANKNERDAAGPLLQSLESQQFALAELHIDRGYLTAPEVVAHHERGVPVVTKPPTPRKNDRFTKADFHIDFTMSQVTCPAGTTAPVTATGRVTFPAAACRECDIRAECLTQKNRRSRQLTLHPQEQWYREMATELATPEGRELRRRRVPVEHALARVDMLQGKRARFRGLHKNRFDLERTAVLNNCYVLGALLQQAA